MKKKLILMLTAVLFCGCLLIAQDTANNINSEREKPVNQTNANPGAVDEAKIILNTQTTTSVSQSPQKEFSFFNSLGKFVLMLLIVCGLAYVILRMLKKANAIPLNDDPYLKVVSSLKLAPNKMLYILTLEREAFLIGVSEKNISLIAKINDADLINRLNLRADSQNAGQKSFAELLGAFFKKPLAANTADQTVSPSREQNATPRAGNQADNINDEFLSEARQRLKNMEKTVEANSATAADTSTAEQGALFEHSGSEEDQTV